MGLCQTRKCLYSKGNDSEETAEWERILKLVIQQRDPFRDYVGNSKEKQIIWILKWNNGLNSRYFSEEDSQVRRNVQQHYSEPQRLSSCQKIHAPARRRREETSQAMLVGMGLGMVV